MIVAGGTYREEIATDGYSEDLGGSAFRAVLAVGAEMLVTAAEEPLQPLLEAAASAVGFSLNNVGRDKAVGFSYLAAFVEPVLRGVGARLASPLAVTGDDVLAFGIVESGDRSIDASTLVYDPQSTQDPTFDVLSAATYTRLAICANQQEVLALGDGASIEASASLVATRTNAEVVVVKAGARGCYVLADSAGTWVGAVPTAAVRKLGSGDVFSAAFAYAWTKGAAAADAARIASHAASWWCGGRGERVPQEILSGEGIDHALELHNEGRQPRVYLAGPFFTIAERWLVEECRRFLMQAGAVVFSPLHDVGLGGHAVANADLEGLGEVDVIMAILDGWDPGTLFEAGWANRKGTPCVAVLSNEDPIRLTMVAGTGAEVHGDYTTAMYRAIWVGLDQPIVATS